KPHALERTPVGLRPALPGSAQLHDKLPTRPSESGCRWKTRGARLRGKRTWTTVAVPGLMAARIRPAIGCGVPAQFQDVAARIRRNLLHQFGEQQRRQFLRLQWNSFV